MHELLQKITERYEGKWIGNEYVCRCPAHDDHDPSLHCTEANGKVLRHCFSGCSAEDVWEAFIRDGLVSKDSNRDAGRFALPPGIPPLYPPRRVLEARGEVPSAANQKLYRCHFTYKDAQGHILGHVVRYQRGDKKETIPYFKFHYNGDWRAGHATMANRPLYGLDLLREATQRSSLVWIVEGEKCADILNRTFPGECALTWPGGCKSVAKADWSSVAGRDVIVWPDFDAGGLLAARTLATVLKPYASSIKFVDITALNFTEEGSDIEQYLAAGNTSLPTQLITEPPQHKFTKKKDNDAPAPKQKPDKAQSSNGLRYPLTEFGNCQRFLASRSNQFFYTSEGGWYKWTGSNWTRDTGSLIKAEAERVIKDIPLEATKSVPPKDAQAILRWAHSCQKNSAVNNLTSLLQHEQSLQKSITDFDADPYIVNCLNGVVDVKTGKLSPHKQEQLCSHITNAPYITGSRCPTWMNFLDFTFYGDPELIDYFHRAVGYCVTGDTSEQIFFATEGPGGTGKGVAFETLAHILGTYAQPVKAEMFLLNEKGSNATGDNSVAAIRGSRLCLSSEINPGARLNEARVKELTGQDTIQARFLYQEFFNFIPLAKFWLRCNGLPVIAGGDSGIWRRVRLLPFRRPVGEDMKNPYLKEALREESDGILTWAIEGARLWLQRRLKPPASCVVEVERYREDMDVVGMWLGDRCVADPQAETMSSTLYDSYMDWCELQGEKPKSQRWLSFDLRQRGFSRVRVPNGSAYHGLRLKNDGIAMEKDFNI